MTSAWKSRIEPRFAEFRLDAECKTCLSESHFSEPRWTHWRKKQPLADITVTDILSGARFVRRCWVFELDGRRTWADAVTGTLYDEASGRCLSSNVRTFRVAPGSDWPAPAVGPLLPSIKDQGGRGDAARTV